MNCTDAQELIAPCFLGALDPEESNCLEAHLDSCSECSVKITEAGEAAAVLALSAPQLLVPPEVKDRLFARIEAESGSEVQVARTRKLAGLMRASRPYLLLHPATALAGLILVVLVLGGVWLNGRLTDIAKDNNELQGQLEAVATAGAETAERLDGQLTQMAEEDQAMAGRLNEVEDRGTQLMQVVTQQRYLTYVANVPGVSVNMLSGSGRMANSRAMVMVTKQGTMALLAALNLPPLPSDKVYQVWLIKGNELYSAGVFTVDPSGYGQTLIRLVVPLGQFDAIAITIEPSGGSREPTGSHILRGDL